MTFTEPWNATGQPAISLPLGRSSEGLPIGVQLVAGPGRDELLLAIAGVLMEAAPSSTAERPRIHA
jgi:amidase